MLLCLIGFISCPIYPKDNQFGEDTLKALYSYKFALFTEWPKLPQHEADEATLSFCIIGRTPFSQAALDAIQGQSAKEKTIRVETYGSGVVSMESLSHCQVAYISQSEEHRVPLLLNAIRSFSILTISDIPGFSSQGGMITLIKSGEHVKFEINLDAIRQAKLSMSSKIVELATVVKNPD
jgi:YfiR/HmsC-like